MSNNTRKELMDAVEKARDALDHVDSLNKEMQDAKEHLDNFNGEKVEVVVPDVPNRIQRKTIISIIITAIALINLAIPYFGFEKINLTDDTIYTIGSYLFIVINMGYALWTNHPISKKARLQKDVAKQALKKADNINY